MNHPGSSLAIEQTIRSWPSAAYMHIPFCRKRCHYCDFATGLGTQDLIERYVQTLCTEITRIPRAPNCLDSTDQQLNTIYFGGGTPSLLTVDQMERILSTLADQIPFAADAEVSMEANPGTITREHLAGYKQVGINRVSLGVQAFQPELLEVCGRLHGVEEVDQAVADLRAVGLDNFSLDLIFGLPHQTLDHWQESLDRAIALAPRHISLYDLTIEAGTKFGRIYQPGSSPLPTEETTVDMYTLAIQTLTAAGYEHYEISNFAQNDYQCRHNRVYWENGSYYGLGMGATGYVQGRRIQQPQTLHEYFQTIDQQIPLTAPVVTPTDCWLDTLMVGLRLREGLDLDDLRNLFSYAHVDRALTVLEPFRSEGWVDWAEGRLRLIPPQGWLFSNTILVTLFDQEWDSIGIR